MFIHSTEIFIEFDFEECVCDAEFPRRNPGEKRRTIDLQGNQNELCLCFTGVSALLGKHLTYHTGTVHRQHILHSKRTPATAVAFGAVGAVVIAASSGTTTRAMRKNIHHQVLDIYKYLSAQLINSPNKFRYIS